MISHTCKVTFFFTFLSHFSIDLWGNKNIFESSPIIIDSICQITFWVKGVLMKKAFIPFSYVFDCYKIMLKQQIIWISNFLELSRLFKCIKVWNTSCNTQIFWHYHKPKLISAKINFACKMANQSTGENGQEMILNSFFDALRPRIYEIRKYYKCKRDTLVSVFNKRVEFWTLFSKSLSKNVET